MNVNRMLASLVGFLALGSATAGFAAPLPSGKDTLDLMAISGPVLQSVPNTSALLLVMTWVEERTHAAVLTIQESASRKFIAEIRHNPEFAQKSGAQAAEIWVDHCFTQSGKACGDVGTRFAGTAEDLQALIVQSIQEHEGKPSDEAGSGPTSGMSAAVHTLTGMP